MQLFTPSHYSLRLEPDAALTNFRGRVTITGTLQESTHEVILDARDIRIHSVEVYDPDQTNQKPQTAEVATDGDTEQLTVQLPKPYSGTISISVTYTGTIHEDLAGLYRASFTENGVARVMAVTQFEETDARRAFPCIDRPWAKARFDIEYVLPAGMEGIANTPIAETRTVAGNKKLLRFETTPVMATYLLFFGMGPFEYETDTAGTVPVRVAARPGQAHYGRNAIEWTKEALSFGEEYTGIPFPISKMDLIACPDFAFGAMENYGAIAFRENRLLIYPGRTPAAEFERVCQITNHEVAHMWFGNLVTPRDWSYIWLNEAFATYLGYVITDTFHPDFEGLDQFLAFQADIAFSRDGLHATVPVEFPDGKELEFGPATTPIIYRKAGCILRMLRLYLGDTGVRAGADADARPTAAANTEVEAGAGTDPDARERSPRERSPGGAVGLPAAPFRAGVQAFLHDFREATADSDDFLRSFSRGVLATPGAPQFSADLLEGWIRTPGYPVVSAALTADGEKQTLSLTSHRFTYLGDERPEERGDNRGNRRSIAGELPDIPLTMQLLFEDGSSQRTVALMDHSPMYMEVPSSVAAVKLNSEQAGFYRVAYSEQMLEVLCSFARAGRLSSRDRYGLLYDMHARVVRGDPPVEAYLSLIHSYFGNEADFLPALELSRSLGQLWRVSGETAQRIAETGNTVLQPAIDRIGFTPRDGERHTDALLREHVLWTAYLFGHTQTHSQLQPRATVLLEHPESSNTPADMRPLLFRIAAAGHANAFELLKRQLKRADITEGESQEVLTALGQLRDRSSLWPMLDYVAQTVPARNSFLAFLSAASNPLARNILWEWFRNSASTLDSMHRFHFLNTFVAFVAADGPGREAEVYEFLDEYNGRHAPVSQETIDMAIEYLYINARLEYRVTRPNLRHVR